jgi:hypothetical protein
MTDWTDFIERAVGLTTAQPALVSAIPLRFGRPDFFCRTSATFLLLLLLFPATTAIPVSVEPSGVFLPPHTHNPYHELSF